MEKPFVELGTEHFMIKAFAVKPLEGYEKPINEENKKELPHCCERHEQIYNHIVEHFKEFPNCCKHHKPLLKAKWFNKDDYNYIIDKVVNQISYSEHCIQKHINDADWYDAITDYFEVNVSSFGQFYKGFGSPLGANIYINSLVSFIKNTELIKSKSKRKALIKFFDYSEANESNSKTDLNVLYATYRKWLKIFPFHLSLFSHLKEHFEKQLPIINGKPKINRYTKVAKVNLHSKESLIETLLAVTNSIITQINTLSLYEKGLLSEPEKLRLELILNERKNQLDEGYDNKSPNEDQRFRNILKDWYKDEVDFINKLTPLLPNEMGELNTNTAKLVEQLNKYKFSKFLTNNNHKPKDIYQLIQVHSGKEQMPYCIALLNELKYLKFFFDEFTKNKTEGYKILAKIFEKPERRIKGNILVLNDNSNENPAEYTSHTFIGNIRKSLKGL